MRYQLRPGCFAVMSKLAEGTTGCVNYTIRHACRLPYRRHSPPRISRPTTSQHPRERLALSAKPFSAIGFLTVVEDDQYGHCGGYLLLNGNGRPLEFHCTAPVKPNRAQEVLYGPTLKPYLHGELIGQTLVQRAKVEPVAICVDDESVLTLRSAVSIPVTLVLPEIARDARSAAESSSAAAAAVSSERVRSQSADERLRVDATHGIPARRSHLYQFSCAGSALAVSHEFADDESDIRQRLEPHLSRLELCEPFERIREAIREARGSKR